MIKIDILDVVGFEAAIAGMRNPLQSWERSDTKAGYVVNGKDGEEIIVRDVTVGENDLDLMRRLYKGGTEHRKYARMINVYMDIEASHTWWAEFDTYKVGTVRNSCSKMHKIHIKPFSKSDFDHEGIYRVGSFAEMHFEKTVNVLEALRAKFNETGEKKYWQALIELLPMGYRLKATVMLNYETVFNIIRQRRRHKLAEWSVFIDKMEQLPYVTKIMRT